MALKCPVQPNVIDAAASKELAKLPPSEMVTFASDVLDNAAGLDDITPVDSSYVIPDPADKADLTLEFVWYKFVPSATSVVVNELVAVIVPFVDIKIPDRPVKVSPANVGDDTFEMP